MIFSQLWKLLREDRYDVAQAAPLSHCRKEATGAGLPHSHSAPYWLTQCRHRGEKSITLGTPSNSKKAKGWAFVHTAMGHSENSIPSEYEKDFLPSVWQSVQCSCILNFRVAFDRKQLYMIVGCECVRLRWKIFSLPCKAFVGFQGTAQK